MFRLLGLSLIFLPLSFGARGVARAPGAEMGRKMSTGVVAGQVWEAFFIQGKKVGFTRRKITLDRKDGEGISHTVVAFDIEGEVLRFRHVLRFLNRDGYPWRSHIFEMPDGGRTSLTFDGKRITGNARDRAVDRQAPPNSVPTYGVYLHLVGVPFEKGASVQLAAIEDDSGEPLPAKKLVCAGQEETQVAAARLKLWRIEEFDGEKCGNTYWLDDQRRVRKSDWQGAESIWVVGKKQALEGLPPAVARLAD